MCALSCKRSRGGSSREAFDPSSMQLLRLVVLVILAACPAFSQEHTPDWQTQVRKYVQTQDWDSALRIVDREVAKAPQDMDVRAWRARVLAWSGHLGEAEKDYLATLKTSRNDPHHSMLLST